MSAPSVAPVQAPGGARRPLPLLIQVLYGVGEVPIAVTMGLFSVYVLFFYNSVMRLDGTLAGVGITIGLVVDAVLDPYIGFRSDTSTFRMGRRQAFMLFGCLGMGPFFWALLSPPQGMSTVQLFCWLLISSLGFRFSFATYRIPYLSLGAELTNDYDERTRVISIRSLLGLLAMAAAATLPLLVFFPRVSGGTDPKLHYAGYPLMGLTFGALMAAGGLAAVFGTQARRTFSEPDQSRDRQVGFFAGMWILMKNPNYRALWISFMLSMLAVVLNFSLWLHFLKWYAGVEEHRMLSAIQVAFYSGAAIGVGMWFWLAKRGEKRTFFAGSLLALVAILALSTFLVGQGHWLGTTHPILLAIGNFVAGLFASSVWVLPFSMMADVVDEEQLVTGLRREGTCFGIMNFGDKIASAGGLLVSGVLLSRFIHLAPGQEGQTADAAAKIGIAYGLIPGAILAVAAFGVLRFSLDRARVREIQAKLGAGGTA